MTETDEASPIKGLVWVIAAAAIAAAFAFGISPLVRIIPWSWEQNISHIGSMDLSEVCTGDSKKEALLNQLVGRLYPIDADDNKFSIHVQIVKDPAVNAFAQLGGKITVNSGLLDKAQSPEEVAGVLAHEIEHVHHRHVLEGFIVHALTFGGMQIILSSGGSNFGWANYFLHMSFSRTQEAEADEGGLQRLSKAHISNQGFKDFFERMKEMSGIPSFLSDHPSNEARSVMAGKFLNVDTKPIMTSDDWKSFKGYCR